MACPGTRVPAAPVFVPELDDGPIYDHERLPSVEPGDLITDDLTVRSFADLSSPPTDLPERQTGLVFDHVSRDADTDVEYELTSASEIEHIVEFGGPQLSFEFAIPEFAEDAIASHITTAGIPWDQPRYDNPAEDITDPTHRNVLAGRYDSIGDPAPVNTLVAAVTEAVSDDDAPEDEGLTTEDPAVESVALFESESTAIPTFGGVVVAHDVPDGEHRLTVNGPGVEPHSESIEISAEDNGPTTAGVQGEIPLVARADAVKLEVDAEGTEANLTNMAVEDDFAGRLYDAPLSEPDAVYVHQGGAFTVEVTDAAEENRRVPGQPHR
ncbi:MAG: hypothetical protein U5J98_01385 [Halobacteriales archaeon]|nr:hypothetical protein [Halobacteriales archaeon]